MLLFAGEPHHDGSALYVSDLAPSLGSRVTVRLRAPRAAGVTAVHVRTVEDGEPRYTEAAVDELRTSSHVTGYGPDDVWWHAEITAVNPVTRYRFLLLTARGQVWLTAGGLAGHDVTDDTDFRLVAHDAPPAWMADAIVYQIFPDRFGRSGASRPLPDWALPRDWDRDPVIPSGPGTSQQFYGGDLDGVVRHLDHVQALGVDTVYLTPIFPARSNHRYNAAAFDRIDPLLGGEEALRRLADALHARGMRLLGDITTNHCGDTHPWFTAAVSDVNAPEREMFFFDPDTGDYEAWFGVKTLPKLNWRSDLVRSRVPAVLKRWLGPLDGWRVDVANMTGRRGADDLTHEVAALLRRELGPEVALVAEHSHDATGDLDRGGWHGTMNYGGFTRPVWTWLRGPGLDLPQFLGVPGGVPARDGTAALATVRTFAARMSWRSLVHSWQLLDSHDTPRIRTVTGSRALHLVALGLQATLPGTPMVFAGSEFGLTGVNGEHARTPMPWDRPADQDLATLAAYRELFGLRRAEPALRHGGLRWLHADADHLVFARECEAETLLVSARRAPGAPLPLPGPATPVHNASDTNVIPGDGPALRIWRLAR
ncbi:glycoside hydrolase family 13 protein [Nonomuraea rhodomycinica]|uniref:Glycoside hydrolase family 13 protein n=1 Tax=Nonomuraea rhodomycinica TaxID=1712872 RepID=A0A7Y6IJ77_9ACTN|nr:glycoside hydrolase family 13 protein [Nonomuraea rhodomycinica]NUW39176.1 glycoside hydrolase family 13 protein [Nonomuraea rhodomycinica]